jgi:hypothetical protein
MRWLYILAIASVATLTASTVALAGTASGTTKILGVAAPDAYSDTPTEVEVSISTGAPVVPYEYSLVNKCWFSGKTSGPSDSYERFDLAGPWYEPNAGDPPTSIELVNVQPVPPGARCKAYIVKNNTVVKGSTTTYDVVPAP